MVKIQPRDRDSTIRTVLEIHHNTLRECVAVYLDGSAWPTGWA
jgi:hypothetical protein